MRVSLVSLVPAETPKPLAVPPTELPTLLPPLDPTMWTTEPTLDNTERTAGTLNTDHHVLLGATYCSLIKQLIKFQNHCKPTAMMCALFIVLMFLSILLLYSNMSKARK